MERIAKKSSKCKGIRIDGEPCQMWEVHGAGYCFRHDPSKKKEAYDASRRGGLGKGSRFKKKADLKKLQTQIEVLIGAKITPGDNGIPDHKTLEDLRLSAMTEIARIESLRTSGELSHTAASGALLQWHQFLRLVMIDGGLGADARIEEMERQISNEKIKLTREVRNE